MKKYAILTKILNALRKFQDLGLSLKEIFNNRLFTY